MHQVQKRGSAENWQALRDEASNKSAIEAVQKTAVAAAENAVLAQRIRSKLLKKLESEIDALPDNLGSESAKEISRTEIGSGKRESLFKRWRLRDLTAAYKDLTADMDLTGELSDDPLDAYLEGMRHA